GHRDDGCAIGVAEGPPGVPGTPLARPDDDQGNRCHAGTLLLPVLAAPTCKKFFRGKKKTGRPSFSYPTKNVYPLCGIYMLSAVAQMGQRASAVPLFVDRGQLGRVQPAAEAVEVLEAHDQRPPGVGVDAVLGPR